MEGKLFLNNWKYASSSNEVIIVFAADFKFGNRNKPDKMHLSDAIIVTVMFNKWSSNKWKFILEIDAPDYWDYKKLHEGVSLYYKKRYLFPWDFQSALIKCNFGVIKVHEK